MTSLIVKIPSLSISTPPAGIAKRLTRASAEKRVTKMAKKSIEQLNIKANENPKSAAIEKIEPLRISLEKMSSTKFEGWKIKLDSLACGKVKFNPNVNEVFKDHVTVDISISKAMRGRHIARIALKIAIEASTAHFFVAHLRKSNIASKKMLTSVGFQEAAFGKQLCMILKK